MACRRMELPVTWHGTGHAALDALWWEARH
jgi:hypothetical protein